MTQPAALPEGQILYRFTTSPQDAACPHDDMAAEYVVLACPEGPAGLIVYGRRSTGEWVSNWSARHVVKRLLEELAKRQEKQA